MAKPARREQSEPQHEPTTDLTDGKLPRSPRAYGRSARVLPRFGEWYNPIAASARGDLGMAED